MKLIVAIIDERICERFLQALIESHYQATQISSSGIFWRRGHNTVLVGVETDQMAGVFACITDSCAQSGLSRSPSQSLATAFVLDVDRYVRI